MEDSTEEASDGLCTSFKISTFQATVPTVSEIDSLAASKRELPSRCSAMEGTVEVLQRRDIDRRDCLNDMMQDSIREAEEATEERDGFVLEEKIALVNENEVLRGKIWELAEERCRRDEICSKILSLTKSVTGCLSRIMDKIDVKEKFECVVDGEPGVEDKLELQLLETRHLHELGLDTEAWFLESESIRKKEKKELENSIASLTEENRDINSLLSIAITEKEAVEKSLNKLKGSGEQKRSVAILHYAERGLQKVGLGFGFMMGTSASDIPSENPNSCSASAESDSSHCEKEVTTLASTVENMMKNLRLEITELKHLLEESRSECKLLQVVADRQAREINEKALNIKCVEERESVLKQNNESIVKEIKEAEEEVSRWREACELEVEAGKAAIDECERENAVIKEELEKTKAALDFSNEKWKLKEKLAVTAMTAQAAAETSLRKADSRSTVLRERIEELTKQLEKEAEHGPRERDRGRRRVRYACWPWQALKILLPDPGGQGQSIRRRMPEMSPLM